MSDFFTNLVLRSSGTAPVIRPRLPSLFEPSMAYAPSFAEDHTAWDLERANAPETAFEARDALPSTPQKAPVVRWKAFNGRTASQLALPVVQTDQADREPPRTPAKNPPLGVTLQQSAAKISAADMHLLPEAQSNSSRRQPASSDEDDDSCVVARSEPKLSARDFIAPPVLKKNPAASTNPVTEPLHRDKSEAPQHGARNFVRTNTDHSGDFLESPESPVKAPPVEPGDSQLVKFSPRATATERPKIPSFEFARHIPRPPLAPSPESTIQVTIGRIEVRASSAQTPTPKERSTSSVMSLNEYLQRRKGGQP
jgi:hypothetical protein